MNKKRRNEVSSETEVPAKKELTSEFNGTEFKTMLKNPTTAMKGLEKFISVARKLPRCDLYDVVAGYVKISMECAEIFKLLEGEKHNENEMLLIFESLEMILLRTASDLSHFRMVGNTIVKKLVSNYMKLLQGSIHSANHRFVMQCLNLLSAMVSQGAEAAREVFSQIHIKSLSGLAKRKDKMGKPDIRLAFIQFVLSFLVSGDGAIIGQILEIKDLLPHILNTGVKEDRMSSVNLILSTLKTRVVLNKAISKTQKVHFFTAAILTNIASLYKWNGIADAHIDDETKCSDSSGLSVVRQLVHSFLLDLCCSRKHGISFHDASFGTAGRAGNLVLLQFLVGLKQATEDELVSDLVVNVLKASPDILSRYFKEIQYSYTPRLTSAWQDNVKLLKKIYEAQPEISIIFQTREVIPPARLLSMVMAISLPPVCNKTFFTQGLCISNPSIQLTTVSVINFILKRANKNMEYLLEKSVWDKSNVYTVEMIAEVVQQYRESLGKILPDMTSIVSTWQSLGKKEKTDVDKKEAKQRGKVELTEDKNKLPAAETAEVIMLKTMILQVICFYQKVVPHLVVQCKFDFSKLLKGIVSEKGIKDEVAPVLQYQILQLALDLPANKFSWFHIQDPAGTDSSSREKSVLYLLLKMFVNSSQLRSSTQQLVVKVLKDTGVFEHNLTELDLWLYQLTKMEPDQQESVIQFLERVLVKLVCNSHKYTDKVASFVQEAANLQANLSNQEGDATSIPVSQIDDMLNEITEGNDGEMEEFGPALSEDIIQTFPFSALVPAALEARNNLSADMGVECEYLSAVLTDVLHCQRDPLALCLALQQYDKEFVSSASNHPSIPLFHYYYSRWIPLRSRKDLFKLPENLSSGSLPPHLSELMKAAYIRGSICLLSESFKNEVEVSLASASLNELPVAVKQILLYIKSTVDNFSTFAKNVGASLITVLMGILQKIVNKVQSFDQSRSSEPEQENLQEESPLFVEVNQSPNKQQVLVAVLTSIFRHPCLEQWFFALCLTVPAHSLTPVDLKRLCSVLTEQTLTLLNTNASTLSELGHPELLSSYMSSLQKCALKELMESGSRAPSGQTQTFRALLSLHHYMDPIALRELVSSLLLLPRHSLISPGPGRKLGELSCYGDAALQILTKHKATARQDRGIFLTRAHLCGLGALFLSCSDAKLKSFLLRTLADEPGCAKLLQTDVLSHCLGERFPDAPAIVSLLLHNSPAHRLRFELWCLEPANIEKLSDEVDSFLPIISTYLQQAGKVDPARPKDVQNEVLKVLTQTLLGKLSQCILGNLAEDSGAMFVETVSKLLKVSADIKDVLDLTSNLPSALQNVDNLERWQLVDVISEKLADQPQELEQWRKSVIPAALKCLTDLFCNSKNQAASPSEQENDILKKLQKLLISAEDVTPNEWNSFVKNGLKHRYQDHHFLISLNRLLEVVYGGGGAKDLIPLSTLHMMITSHSQFLPTMLDADNEPVKRQSKDALVSLLLFLVGKCPSVCHINHFLVLLGAYGATLSTSDQKLLLLLQEYERNQVSLLKFQSFMWGAAALEHHKTRKSLGASLWKQTSSDDMLALLQVDKMLQTVAEFPQQRCILTQDRQELIYSNDSVKDLGNLYDPCFLLPLFSAILRPECVIDCHKFVSSHALELTVTALSSFDPKTRAAAYHVLSCFYQHLEAARFREKRQLLYLMDMLKNGILEQNQRLPFVLTTYICKVTQQMLKPEDHMYVVLNRLLLSHQSLDFRRVPEFFKLFFSFDLEHKVEREWILNVLEEGISAGHCYEVCSRQRIFQILLCFSSSPLCDEQFEAQIMRVLCRAARVTKATCKLTKSCGLLSWIIQILDKRTLNQQLLCAATELLHTLWFTTLKQKSKRDNPSSSNEEKPQDFVKCLQLPLVNEFLCVASTISGHLRLGVKATQLHLFVQTLCSMLMHRRTAIRTNKQANQLALHQQPLSCSEILCPLLCWASLSSNTVLISQIQTLSEKHKVRELIGKNKVRAKSSISYSHIKEENLRKNEETESEEEILLAECKSYFCRIFTHWEPVFQQPDSQSALPKEKQDCSHLSSDTAHLLTKWSLRWLVENPEDGIRVKEFLFWFERAVVKHKEITRAVMSDLALKADVLRLYHHTCETQSHSSGTARTESIQIFTNIMLHLLETLDSLPMFHQGVVSTCWLEDACDESKRDAGLFLLSMYIHELWSGAASPELFLSHAHSVSGAKIKQNSKSPKNRTALEDICRKIIAMKH